MDIFTHALLPFALLAALRRPRAAGLAAGLGGAMPDIDAFFTWVARLDDALYGFTHRGWSHSLWGAPLLAVVGLVVLAQPWWARRWPRMAAFQATPETLAAAALGGLLHVAVDALTISGVPALWPLSTERVTANLFFYSALYMTPVGVWLIWRLAKGRLDDALLMKGAALLVAAIVVGGAVRLATQPRELPDGAVVQPTPSEVRWVVAVPVEGGWDVRDHAALGEEHRFVFVGNATPAAAEAVARARALGTYVAWSWVNPAPVVNATAIEGGWRVEFRDAVALHRDATGGVLAGLLHEPEPLAVEVRGGDARVVGRPWGWGFG